MLMLAIPVVLCALGIVLFVRDTCPGVIRMLVAIPVVLFLACVWRIRRRRGRWRC
jgi:hypothetical protein